MENLADILREDGHWLIFALVFLDFLGAPLPSFLLLLGAGALAPSSELWLASVGLVAALAALTGDLVLYGLGALKCGVVLGALCRMTADPNRCVRRAEDVFSRFGVTALFLAKVAPGLKLVATPMAGAMRMPMKKFVFYDGLGAVTWAAAFTGIGYLGRLQFQRIGRDIERATMTVAIGLGLLILGSVIWRLASRRWPPWPEKTTGERDAA